MTGEGPRRPPRPGRAVGPGRPGLSGPGQPAVSGPAAGGPDRPELREGDAPRRGMQRLGDLLPDAARHLGLEDELELAGAMTAWQRIVAEHVPAAAGSCRMVSFAQGVATVETAEPIVAQELRMRLPELVTALRSALPSPVRQLRVTVRHV